ncbi:hypothetical protein PAXRUDRAFT_157828, partial [Paxillus rubicundulus Ve08.2h10]
HIIPPPCSSFKAYLLLEAAQSDQQISLMRKDLTNEIIHHNTITLQLNHIMLEKAQENLHVADQFISHVHLVIRQSGYPATYQEYMMQESYSQHKGMFYILLVCMCVRSDWILGSKRGSTFIIHSQCSTRLVCTLCCNA